MARIETSLAQWFGDIVATFALLEAHHDTPGREI